MEQANSVEAYLKIIERFNDYPEKYYRGQLEKYKTILPSIARDNGYLEYESSIYHEVLDMSTADFSGLDTPLKILAKMQHYDVPTRLVDVTIDPLVALFFAVNNTEDPSAGTVLLYISSGFEPDSIEAKVLSIIPTLKERSIRTVQDAVKTKYNVLIQDDELVKILTQPSFIQYSGDLKKANPRLYMQKGTFLICGNEINEGCVSKTIRSLDTIAPCTVIRIPYEYKQAIKDELDIKYNISSPTMFPELTSVAKYIKEKYKEKMFSSEGKYYVAKIQDISMSIAKRVSITVVLKQTLVIEEIKRIAIDAMEKYKDNNQVIWVNVANNGDDLITYNWILRGQWIDPSLDERFRPLPLKTEENGYYWDFGKSYSVLSDYYSEYVFEEDVPLFVWHSTVWERFTTVFNELLSVNRTEAWPAFADKCNKYESQIKEFYMQLQDFGRSHNKEFDGFLDSISDCVSSADDIILWLRNDKLSEREKKRQIEKEISNVNNRIPVVSEGFIRWRNELGITKEDFSTFDLSKRVKRKYNYTQTLPISTDALEVSFDVLPEMLPDGRIQVKGRTNLYDGAILMLTVREEGSTICCQGKATIEKGVFEFPVFSNQGKGFPHCNLTGELFLSLPSTQPKEFTKLAGVEYERLKGNFIKRDGIGPVGSYRFSFSV